MNPVYIDGVLVDTDSGEILEGPADKLAYAVAQYIDSKEQIKAHEQQAAIWQQSILRYQPEKSVTYGSKRISIRQNKRRDQDIDAIREFIRDAELTRDDALNMALSAKGFDTATLTEHLRDAVEGMTNETLTRPFVVVDTVRKPAPAVVPAEVEADE